MKSDQDTQKNEKAAPGLPERLLKAIGDEPPYGWGIRAGISKSTLEGILKKGSTPQRGTLIKIAYATDISLNYLLTGKGPVRLASSGKGFTPSLADVDGVYLVRKGYVLVPRYEVTASAGDGGLIHQEEVVDHLAFKADWIKGVMGLDARKLALVGVKGDSMEPTLQEGNLVLLDLREREVRNDAIYVIRRDDTLIAKRLQRDFEGNIHIQSDNPVYEKMTVSAHMVEQRLKIVGRVVWAGRRL
ncbi:MAG: helix-turn-helix transcriptional regulator [Magnetococcales bacterium]|nr:helix-turn-helix transcriptional regulator [Magnetococcales bacterium]